MATITQVLAEYAKRAGGGAAPIRHYPEKASQTFGIRAFVKLDTNGQLLICTDDDTACKGIALKAASGTANVMCPVLLAEPDVEFEVNVYHGTAASAITNKNQVTKRYALQMDGSKGYCDIEDTTNDFFEVKSLSTKDAEGDIYGRVLVKVLDAVYQAEV